MGNLRLVIMSLNKSKKRNFLIFIQFFITFIALIFSLGLLMDIYIKLDNARKVLPPETSVIDYKIINNLNDTSKGQMLSNEIPLHKELIDDVYKENKFKSIAYYTNLDINGSLGNFKFINANRTLHELYDFKITSGRKLSKKDLEHNNNQIPVIVGENVAKIYKLNSPFKLNINLKEYEFKVVGIIDNNIKFWVTNPVFVENMKNCIVSIEQKFENDYNQPTIFIPANNGNDVEYCNTLISKYLKVGDKKHNYFRSLNERLYESLKDRKENLFYLLSFSAILFLLSLSGVLSLVLLSISKRRREFGIRLSIGSYPREIAKLVVGEVALIMFIAFILAFIIGFILNLYLPKDIGIVINGYVFALSLVINLLSIGIISILPQKVISKYTPNNLIRGV